MSLLNLYQLVYLGEVYRVEIPQNIIDKVKDSNNIVDIVSDRVVLKKRGKVYVGLCPFHQENTPSFTVNEEKQLYHCFGCKAGGDVVNFLMSFDSVNFREAISSLAHQSGIDLPVDKPNSTTPRISNNIIKVLALASASYQSNLVTSHNAQAYLTSRAIDLSTAKTFNLGYAKRNALIKALLSEGISIELMITAGLVVQNGTTGEYQDRLRDRLIFPIKDSYGNVIAFTGRTLTEQHPKYLHSATSDVFDKSKTLLGLYEAKEAIAATKQAIVVEGNFDLIALHQAGYINTVACLGTAFTKDHLVKLAKVSKGNIVFNFDSDAAGIAAISKFITSFESELLNNQVRFKVVTLPAPYKDVAEFIAIEGKEAYAPLLLNARPWLEWLIDSQAKDCNLANKDDLFKLGKVFVSLLGKLPVEMQLAYLPYCADKLGQGDTSLTKLYMSKLKDALTRPVTRQALDNNSTRPKEDPELILLHLYLGNIEERLNISRRIYDLELVFSDRFKQLWEDLEELEMCGTAPYDLVNALKELSQDRGYYDTVAEVFNIVNYAAIDFNLIDGLIKSINSVRLADKRLQLLEQIKNTPTANIEKLSALVLELKQLNT